MSATKEYVVNINGIDHTMLLNEEDAERYGAKLAPAKARAAANVSNKARSAGSGE